MTESQGRDGRLRINTSWPPKGRIRRTVLGLAGLIAAGGTIMVLSAGGAAAQGVHANAAALSGTVTWDGKTGLSAIKDCTGQGITYHWILTPGGSTQFISGTLDVTYTNGTPATSTSGAVNGNGNGNGAMQFFVTLGAFDTPATAVATVEYTGSLANSLLTISGTECTGGSSTPPSSTPPSSTPPSSTPPSSTPPTSAPPSLSSSPTELTSTPTSAGPIPGGVEAGLHTPVAGAGLKAWGIVLMVLGGAAGLLAGLWPTRQRAH